MSEIPLGKKEVLKPPMVSCSYEKKVFGLTNSFTARV